MGTILQLIDISKSFSMDKKNITVLRDINLSIEEEEFVMIVGPSGCGKSTLLRIIAGLTPPTTGKVLLGTREVIGINPKVAMIFQNFALLPWLTVRENVELGLEARGLPKNLRREKVQFYIDKVGLGGYEEAYPRELSGGMKQRVGVARALAVEPEILCMDEPFSSLDALTAANLREEALLILQDPTLPIKACLMVTHLIEEAVLLGDRVIVLSHLPGSIVADVKIELPRPRNPKQEGFDNYCDEIFSFIGVGK